MGDGTRRRCAAIDEFEGDRLMVGDGLQQMLVQDGGIEDAI